MAQPKENINYIPVEEVVVPEALCQKRIAVRGKKGYCVSDVCYLSRGGERGWNRIPRPSLFIPLVLFLLHYLLFAVFHDFGYRQPFRFFTFLETFIKFGHGLDL